MSLSENGVYPAGIATKNHQTWPLWEWETWWENLWDFGVQYDGIPACLANPDPHHVINLSKPSVRCLKIKYISISCVCYILIALSQYISISVYRAANHYLEDHRTVHQWFSCASSLSYTSDNPRIGDLRSPGLNWLNHLTTYDSWDDPPSGWIPRNGSTEDDDFSSGSWEVGFWWMGLLIAKIWRIYEMIKSEYDLSSHECIQILLDVS